jgi:hypothetical protein
VAHALTTDGFGFSTMRQLATALHNVGSGGVQLLTVPLNPSPTAGVPTADVQWDPAKAPVLWNAILHDRPIPASATSKKAGHKQIHAKTASKEGCLK